MSLRQRPQQDGADAGNAGVAESDADDEGIARAPKKFSEVRRRLMLSRTWKWCMLVVVGSVPIFGILFALPVALRLRGCRTVMCQLRHYCFSVYLTVLFLYNFVEAQFTDPGRTDKVKPTFETTGQYQILLGAEGGELSDVKQIGSEEPLMYAPNYCNHCKHWKPPRAHHCGVCQRCTLRMDHHCPFTGNCIGLKNHGHFLLMYLFAAIGLLYSMAMVTSAIAGSFQGPRRMTPSFRPLPMPPKAGYFGKMKVSGQSRHVGRVPRRAEYSFYVLFMFTEPVLLVQVVLTAAACGAVFCLGIAAWAQAFRGNTLLELLFPMKEYVQIRAKTYCPLGIGFYHLGWRQNIRDLLGPSWRLRLFLPLAGSPLDWRVGLAPQPSPTGVQGILDRIQEVEAEGVKSAPKSNEELGINCGPDASSAKNV